MNLPSKEVVEERRRKWRPGMKIRLLHMDDPQAPTYGTCGTVVGVDDGGQIMVNWDNGSHLSVIPEVGDQIAEVK